MVQIHGLTLQGPAEKNQAVKDPFFHAFNEEERCIPIMERKIPIATVIFCLCGFHISTFNSRYKKHQRIFFSCFFSVKSVTGWFQPSRQNIMQSKEIQAFIDCAWEEKGVFVHIDPDLPTCILTSKGALGQMPSAPKTILAHDLEEARACLSVLFPG